MKERYECTIGKHNKWWEIEYDADGTGFITYWGKIGNATRGSKHKQFENTWEARKAWSKIVQSKLDKGYTRISTISDRRAPIDKTSRESEGIDPRNIIGKW